MKGPLGFLVFDENGTRLFEGNQGIKDQQLAMQWVQDNIEKFGGNKSMVWLIYINMSNSAKYDKPTECDIT